MKTKTKIPPWSYSRINTFSLCPRKYFYSYVAEGIPEPESPHLVFGSYVHKACEDYIKEGKPFPRDIAHYAPYLEQLKKIEGDKFAEYKVGLKIEDGKLVSCDFFDPNVWFRGVIDLLILGRYKAHIFDYKTGKSSRYADDLQLKLMAASVFIRWPKIETIKAGLVFLVADDVVRRQYEFKDRLEVFAELDEVLRRREKAYETGVFNPKPNFTCRGYCHVTDCSYNEERR